MATDLSVSLAGMELDNPIIPASGCFGYGREFADYYDINILGSFCTKGTTKDPRLGNPTPRIAEASCGMLNSVGLQNPGIDMVAKNTLPNIGRYFSKQVIANVSGFSVEEFVYCTEALNEVSQVGIIEVNISCPNVVGGGMTFGVDAKVAEKLVYEV